MMKFVTLFMTIVTMFTLGIYNISLENNNENTCVRLHDQESVNRWVDSGNFNETGNVVWNLDSEEL